MFAERFDALMNIAEVSNSLLGRHVNMNPSYIGRLRSGARPLPKKHGYLTVMCRYLAGRIKKDYQFEALRKLTGINFMALDDLENAACALEQWLLEQEEDTLPVSGRLISGFSRLSAKPANQESDEKSPQKVAAYLYGNAGKRKAVEQFFTMILQEEQPQTLLLYSDENMAWLYEDARFAKKWAELFKKVVAKDNRVKIIHSISRDMNEMMEAVTKWIPIYLSGKIEAYYYPRLKDGIFQRTLFIAPKTAAIVSSSVRQDTNGMLNLFLTDQAALNALTAEYNRYLALCRPLMHIYTLQDADTVQKMAENFSESEGDAYLCSAIPPFFTLPKKTVLKLSEQSDNDFLIEQWQRSQMMFEKRIKKQCFTLVLQDPRCVFLKSGALCPPMNGLFSCCNLPYTKEDYQDHIEYLKQTARQYERLALCFVNSLEDDILLYVKENTGVIMIKSNAPQTAFVISEKNMVGAFWDYISKCVL